MYHLFNFQLYTEAHILQLIGSLNKGEIPPDWLVYKFQLILMKIEYSHIIFSQLAIKTKYSYLKGESTVLVAN